MTAPPLTLPQAFLLYIASLLVVGFGQPVWGWQLGALAAAIGFALFWRVLVSIERTKKRFWLATAWFTGVQGIQLFWMTYHPYAYIYAVYAILALFNGLLFGLVGIFITRNRLEKWISILGIASLWAILEWSRLHFFSGYSWNPVGLALAGNIYSLQAASLVGIFGLSFWVFFVNLAALRAWLRWPAPAGACIWLAAVILPLAYGAAQLSHHQEKMAKTREFTALLVQTAFPAEEALEFKDLKHYVAFVVDEWRQILAITKSYVNEKIDLLVLPEYVVPFGTYSFVYPYEIVRAIFQEAFGTEAVESLPLKELPYAKQVQTSLGPTWAVNNAFWAQGLANIFRASAIVGLEDAEDVDGQRERYSAAIYFTPQKPEAELLTTRYEKRVLVPMAEYLPFAFCRQMAAQYGISGSFTCGKEAQIYSANGTAFGVSICYEETFGQLMSENKKKGAELLVNLTSDVWFPNSLLPYQHLEHSRLRTVENGIPLVRACNTGITSAINSAGQTVSVLGETRQQHEWSSGCLLAKVPLYSYETLYSKYGDWSVLLACFGFVFLWGGFSLLKIDPLF